MKKTGQQMICDHLKMEGFVTIFTPKEMCCINEYSHMCKRLCVTVEQSMEGCICLFYDTFLQSVNN